MQKVLTEADNDPALVVKMLSLPTENYIAAQRKPADIDAIHTARVFLKATIALEINNFKY